MVHTSEGTLQAYLDGELSTAERDRVASHLAVCPACTAEAGALRSAAERFSLLVSGFDVPAPGLEPDSITRFRWIERTMLARRILARAAVLLVFVSAAAAAALPGSPIRHLAVDLWNEARSLVAPAPEAVAPAPAPTPEVEAPSAAVSVQPLRGRLHFTISDAAPGIRVRVQLIDGDVGVVRASGKAMAARFTTGVGHIQIGDVQGGDLIVQIPRSALSAVVRANGRALLLKQGDSLRLLSTPVDSSAAEIVFLAQE